MKLMTSFILIIIFLNGCAPKFTSHTLIGEKSNTNKSDSLVILNNLKDNYGGDQKFLPADEFPEPIGGMQVIAAKLYYTSEAVSNNIEGRVLVQFIVNKDGNTENIRVIKGLGYGLDEIGINAIKTTKFSPGKVKGEPVDVETTLPLTFKIE